MMPLAAEDAPYPTELTASGATVVLATGRLNFPEVENLRQQLLSYVERGAVRMAIDLSSVRAIDSAGVGALISGLKAARVAGGDLRLVAPSTVVSSVLDVMNLNRILTTHKTAEEAFPIEP